MNRNKNCVSFVAPLVGKWNPLTVFLRVVPVIVYSFYRVSLWSFSDVRKKLFITVIPRITHFYSSPPIVLIVRVLGVITSLLDRTPYLVFWRPVFSGVPVGNRTRNKPIYFVTPATLGVPVSQFAPDGCYLFPTPAKTNPCSIDSPGVYNRGGAGNNRQPTGAATQHILGDIHCQRIPHISSLGKPL